MRPPIAVAISWLVILFLNKQALKSGQYDVQKRKMVARWYSNCYFFVHLHHEEG